MSSDDARARAWNKQSHVTHHRNGELAAINTARALMRVAMQRRRGFFFFLIKKSPVYTFSRCVYGRSVLYILMKIDALRSTLFSRLCCFITTKCIQILIELGVCKYVSCVSRICNKELFSSCGVVLRFFTLPRAQDGYF